MPNKITNLDYIKILNFYHLEIPKDKNDIKKLAEDILAKKLCRCIKKIDSINTNTNTNSNEAKSIGICTRTIFNSKGLTRGKFKCKNGRSVKIGKRTLKKR
jgi:hypothetical protein